MSLVGTMSQQNVRHRNRRVGLILTLFTLLYLAALIGFIIVY